ncbi:MAG: NADH-dependent [FeFe] hydrogenase, group A6 [Acutalibacteraceae bacterium]
MINITINNNKLSVPEGTTILNAAKSIGIEIPTLCYHPDQQIKASCRVCVVEVAGSRTLQTACSTPVTEGMIVKTNTEKVRKARKACLELLLSDHDADCVSCTKNLNCELQKLAMQSGIRENIFESILDEKEIDTSSPSLVRNPNKCIKCGRCIEMCKEVQGLNIIDYAGRGHDTVITPAFGKYLSDAACVVCGQCSVVCPVAAITEKEDIDLVWEAIDNPKKHVVVQTAPAVRVSIGEEFGLEPGSIVTGKLVAGLRKLGFDKVFDTDFTADLTIIEEGNELIERIKTGGTLPMMTSCSPGWINYIEQYYPELLDHVSTCKSPQQMFGAMAKTYYAEKINVSPEDIVVVSIMPCTAKKFECKRPEMSVDGKNPEVDVVLTTRELAKMFKQAGLDIRTLPEEEYDAPFGITTGAAVIFGATGGVMEAALRTVYEVVTGKTLEKLDFTDVRGLEGIKESVVDLNGTKVKVAVAHSLVNAKKLLELIKSGKCDYTFIEVMCCPGGCIGGGGQPYGGTNEIKLKRIDATYQADRDLPLRKSHESPAVKAIYDEYLKQPLGEKSHKYLHTHYTNRKKAD